MKEAICLIFALLICLLVCLIVMSLRIDKLEKRLPLQTIMSGTTSKTLTQPPTREIGKWENNSPDRLYPYRYFYAGPVGEILGTVRKTKDSYIWNAYVLGNFSSGTGEFLTEEAARQSVVESLERLRAGQK